MPTMTNVVRTLRPNASVARLYLCRPSIRVSRDVRQEPFVIHTHIHISNKFNLIVVKYWSKHTSRILSRVVGCCSLSPWIPQLISIVFSPFVCVCVCLCIFLAAIAFSGCRHLCVLFAPRFPARYIETVHACHTCVCMCVVHALVCNVQLHWLAQHVRATGRMSARARANEKPNFAIKIKSELCRCVFYLCLCYFNPRRCVRWCAECEWAAMRHLTEQPSIFELIAWLSYALVPVMCRIEWRRHTHTHTRMAHAMRSEKIHRHSILAKSA